jgi:hypothetical protein
MSHVDLGGFGYGTFLRTIRTYTPTGTAVDSANIQALLDSLSGVGELRIASGTALITTPLIIPSNIVISGSPGTIMLSGLTPTGGQTQAIFWCGIPVHAGIGTITTTPGVSNTVVVGGWTGTAPTVGQILGFQSGNSFSTYDIVAVSGSGPYTCTLDRVIVPPFDAGDTAITYDSQPNNIAIYGNGMRLRGLVDRYIELGAVHRGLIDDVHMDGVGGGYPTAPANGSGSFDTGGRDCHWRRCTADLTGRNDAVFGLGLESIDGGSIVDCTVRGGNTGFYAPDCVGVTMTRCHAYRVGRGTGGGTGYFIGKSATGMGAYNCALTDSEAPGCHFGASFSTERPMISNFAAPGCVWSLNVNSNAAAVEVFGMDASGSNGAAICAADTVIHGLRALNMPAQPGGGYGLVTATGGRTRIYNAKIQSTATTFIAAACRVVGGTGMEIVDSEIQTNDATNGYLFYGSSGDVKLRNVKAAGAMAVAIRLDNGLSGSVSGDCDFSAAVSPVLNTTATWKMDPPGGVGTVAMADANKTATWTQSYVDVITCTGALTANRTLTIPIRPIGHVYTIDNATTGGFSIVVSFGTGATVSCAAGISRVYFDGTNAVRG